LPSLASIVNVERAKITQILSRSAYATAADFEQIFTEGMGALYLLSFVLTGDREKAEQCFVSGVEECARGNRVFKEWARSWARRTIVRSAIRLVAPLQQSENAMRNSAAAGTLDNMPLVSQGELSAILGLKPLERFVFVMSALAGYSDHDCSVLLGCSPRNVIAARERALQRLGMLMKSPPNSRSEHLSEQEKPTPGIELKIERYFPTLARSLASDLSSPAAGA
jgi:DNA-directed RNA polymerase specialized sigma24 family protein